MSITKVKIGIIGGSGLNKPDVLDDRRELSTLLDTPFGKASDVLISGKIGGIECVLLCRHGRNHQISPTNVNYRANMWILKEYGCTHVIATTACGSLQESIHPGDLVFIDQFIDRTTKRVSTFYDGTEKSPPGIAHVPMHTPFCGRTINILVENAKEIGLRHHATGTVVTIEGPRFSSRAESKLFQSWDAHIINMTTIPEVVLANELGLCYSAIGLVTDYDCWRDNEAGVSKDAVMETMKQNFKTVVRLLVHALPRIAEHNFDDVIAKNKDVSRSSVM